MKPTEGHAVVEFDPAVRHVDCTQRCRDTFTEISAQCQIDRDPGPWPRKLIILGEKMGDVEEMLRERLARG